jgi:hypothetical protein
MLLTQFRVRCPAQNFTAKVEQARLTKPANVSSNSYSWTPGTFAVPGKKFFIMLEDSSGAKAYGNQFVVGATASTTTSATSSSTTKPKSTSSKTATTTSSTASSSATLSPGETQESKDKAEENKRLAMGLGITFGFLASGGVCIILIGLIGKRRKKKEEAGVGGGDIGAGGTDGASDPRLTEKRRFLGFWDRKGGKKGYTGVAQVHELQAHDSPGVQELDGTMRHELQ